jgi:uncharacterized repeat protein (TIGR03803 family)
VLYGTTVLGGTSDSLGVVFSLTPSGLGATWTEEVLHAFTGKQDGEYPVGNIAAGPDGALYVATSGIYGEYPSGGGTVFALLPPASPGGSWVTRTLHDFGICRSGCGAFPSGGVTIGRGGVLYGTTLAGGSANNGTAFALTPPASPEGRWTSAVLSSFLEGGSDGTLPIAGVAIGDGGRLYGTTNGSGLGMGAIYSLTPPASPGGTWTETVLHSFNGSPGDGGSPAASVVIGREPGGQVVLYGTTQVGGTSNAGTVFALRP